MTGTNGMISENSQKMETEKKIEKVPERRGCFFLIGPPTALMFMAMSIAGPVLTDLIVYRTCLVSLQINSTECLMLRTNAGSPEAMVLEAKVAPYASTVVMVKTSIESLLPAMVCLFLGPWSDRGGRKPLLLISCIGSAFSYVILTFMCDWNISPWYLLLGAIPANIVGGFATLRLGSVCYISDTTAHKNRTLQLALLDVALSGGIMLGGLVAPWIYRSYGYVQIFGSAVACCGMALAIIYFHVPETLGDCSAKVPIHGLFQITFVKELFTSVLMKRERYHRPIIWLSICILISSNMISQGDTGAVEFLFTRTRLGWNVQNYSHFNVVDSAMRMIGLCAIFLRNRIPGVTDTWFAAIGMVSSLGSAITRSLTWKDWHMYLSVCVGVFNQITSSALRSTISKFVPVEDIGKVFSLAALLEVLGNLAVTPLYTFIYSHYLPPIYPSPVYIFSTHLWVLLIISVLCVEVLIRKSGKSSTYVATAQEDF